MIKDIKSNVVITSNVYPINTDDPVDDPVFRKKVIGNIPITTVIELHYRIDPSDQGLRYSTEDKKRKLGLENWQIDMIETDMPCTIHPEKEYTFGPVRKGKEIEIICRCKEKSCRLFSECRRERY